MAWKKLNLDIVSLDRLAVLFHGAYAVGKTHFEGDFLREAVKAGKKARFINLAGEDGYMTLGRMGLGEIGMQIESVEDFTAAIGDCVKEGVQALAVDSLPAYSDLVRLKLFGSVRDPDPVKDGERARMLWSILKRETRNGVILSRMVPHVLWVSAHDKGEDPIEGGKSITPDLVGQQARASIGWFDFVGHMRAQTVSPTKVNRWIDVAPDERVATRQRLPSPILDKIVIPEGGGGWSAFIHAVEKALEA